LVSDTKGKYGTKLWIFEERFIRRLFEPKREEVTE
jgi:hypothetical protein